MNCLVNFRSVQTSLNGQFSIGANRRSLKDGGLETGMRKPALGWTGTGTTPMTRLMPAGCCGNRCLHPSPFKPPPKAEESCCSSTIAGGLHDGPVFTGNSGTTGQGRTSWAHHTGKNARKTQSRRFLNLTPNSAGIARRTRKMNQTDNADTMERRVRLECAEKALGKATQTYNIKNREHGSYTLVVSEYEYACLVEAINECLGRGNEA